MAENNPNQINIQYYGRELAKVGDTANERAEDNNWNYEDIIECTGCVTFGFTAGIVLFFVGKFVHKTFIKNK